MTGRYSGAAFDSEKHRLTQHSNGRLSKLLASLAEDASHGGKDKITLATLQKKLGHRSTGTLLVLLALPMVLPIPAPGIATAFGVPLALISAQMMSGHGSLWLPGWLAKRGVTRAQLKSFVNKALPMVCRVEKLVKPRLEFFTHGWALRLAGAMGTLMGIIMALPIFMGNVMPAVAIFLMALGMIGRDGALMLAGLVTGVLALALIGAGGMAVAAVGKEFLAAF